MHLDQSATGPSGTVIRGACIVSMDPHVGVLPSGDIHFVGNTIRAIAADLQVPAGTLELSGHGRVVLPGLVDCHRHPWQTILRGLATDYTVIQYRDELRGRIAPRFSPSDVYASTLLGDLEALNAGVTTVADLAHIMNSPEHADAAIQAHEDSGIRAVFAHGTPNDGNHEAWYQHSRRTHPSDIRRLREGPLADGGRRVTLGMHARPPYLVSREVLVHDLELAADLGLHVLMDGGLGGGCWGAPRWGEPGRQPIRDLDEAGLLGPSLTLVHCNNLPADELARIASNGSHVAMSPDAEMNCGHGEPATLRLLSHGIRPGLSIDSVVWASGDLFTAMRTTLNSARGTIGRRAYRDSEAISHWEITAQDVLEFATIRSAAACGLSREIGALTPGKKADFIVLAPGQLNLEPLNNPIGSVVMAAHPGNVEAVFVDGIAVKQNGQIASFAPDEALALANEARSRVLEGHQAVSADSTTRTSWAWV